MRVAHHADEKGWKEYVEVLTVPPEEIERRKSKAAKAGLARMFGGGK